MSTWLTQIATSCLSIEARRDTGDAVRMHQRVMSLVPDALGDSPRQRAGALYRIERTLIGARILIQTQCTPSLLRLPARYGTAQVHSLDPLLNRLDAGSVVHYRLAANTCLRKSRSKTVIPLHGADAENWWITRAPGCGLDLQSLGSRRRADAVGTVRDNPGARIRHALTQFDGVAIVTDPTALRRAIITGVGRGKSHGCGLLSITSASAAR